MEQEKQLVHKVSLDEREKLTMTGATEVIHFEEEIARLNTSRGEISIYGRGMKLKTLSLDGGSVSISGEIDGIFYENGRKDGKRSKLWG